MSHAMVTTAIGKKLFLAPISDQVQRILDIGTGTGIWAIEAGKSLSRSRSVGYCVCVTPAQIPFHFYHWHPRNGTWPRTAQVCGSLTRMTGDKFPNAMVSFLSPERPLTFLIY